MALVQNDVLKDKAPSSSIPLSNECLCKGYDLWILTKQKLGCQSSSGKETIFSTV